MKIIMRTLILIFVFMLTLSACGAKQAADTGLEAGGLAKMETENITSVSELLSLGEKYLLELNYEQAIVMFTRVIEIEPMNPRGYIGVAQAYIGIGDEDKAIAVLEQGLDKIDSTDIAAMLESLKASEPASMAENEP